MLFNNISVPTENVTASFIIGIINNETGNKIINIIKSLELLLVNPIISKEIKETVNRIIKLRLSIRFKLKRMLHRYILQKYEMLQPINNTNLICGSSFENVHTVYLIQNNKKFLFTAIEVIKMIKSFASFYEDYEISKNLVLKNPYTNIEITFANIFNMYMQLVILPIKIPWIVTAVFHSEMERTIIFSNHKFYFQKMYSKKDTNDMPDEDFYEMLTEILKFYVKKKNMYIKIELLSLIPIDLLKPYFLNLIAMFTYCNLEDNDHASLVYIQRQIEKFTYFNPSYQLVYQYRRKKKFNIGTNNKEY